MTKLLLAVTLAVSSVAVAQNSKQKPKVTVINIDQDGVIEGGIDRPMVDELISYRRPDFKSLIKMRENFDDKIVKSVDQM